MAIYHFTMKIGSRSKGQSAVAAAAYRSGKKLLDEEIGKHFDYTRKGGIIFSELSICKEAPSEYSDREVLWNAVHKVEKVKNAQLWREIEVALPREFSRARQIKVVRRFVSHLVDKGMCADWSLHDKNDGNPHAHIMLTLRSIKPDGTWAPKCRKDYKRDKNGKLVERKELDSKGRIQYQRIRVNYNDWNDKNKAEEWRKLWADCCNRYLHFSNKIDHRSYEKQGIVRIPTIHEGYAARKRKNSGLDSDRVRINDLIAKSNVTLEECETELLPLEKEKKKLDKTINKLEKKLEKKNRKNKSTAQEQNDIIEDESNEEYEFAHKSKKTDDAKSEVADSVSIKNDAGSQNSGSEISSSMSSVIQNKTLAEEEEKEKEKEKEVLEKQKAQKQQQQKTEKSMADNNASAFEQQVKTSTQNTAVSGQAQKAVPSTANRVAGTNGKAMGRPVSDNKAAASNQQVKTSAPNTTVSSQAQKVSTPAAKPATNTDKKATERPMNDSKAAGANVQASDLNSSSGNYVRVHSETEVSAVRGEKVIFRRKYNNTGSLLTYTGTSSQDNGDISGGGEPEFARSENTRNEAQSSTSNLYCGNTNNNQTTNAYTGLMPAIGSAKKEDDDFEYY